MHCARPRFLRASPAISQRQSRTSVRDFVQSAQKKRARLTVLRPSAERVAEMHHDQAQRLDGQDLFLAVRSSQLGVLELILLGQGLDVRLGRSRQSVIDGKSSSKGKSDQATVANRWPGWTHRSTPRVLASISCSISRRAELNELGDRGAGRARRCVSCCNVTFRAEMKRRA